MYFQYYLMGIILLPGLLLATFAQFKVKSTYSKYRNIYSSCGLTACDFIKRLMSATDTNYLQIRCINGHLTDHYNPSKEEICLSQDVYSSSSVAALGIACHEFGHALQKKEKYLPYQIRRILVPITNFASTLLWPLVVIGLIFNFGVEAGGITGDIFLWSGIIVFGLSVLFNLATLPVEFNASRRAVKILKASGTLTEDEIDGTKKVLTAAALTYVAALVVSILNLLRFLLVVLARTRRD